MNVGMSHTGSLHSSHCRPAYKKEEEDLKGMSGFCRFRGWRISLHKQGGLDWKSAKKNVRADHKVVNPQTGGRKLETLQATEVCVAAMFVG